MPDLNDTQNSGASNNPLGDPRAFRGYSTTLRKLAQKEKKSDFLPSFGKSFGSFLWEVAKIIIIALAIIKPIHYFLLQPFYVKGASMEPNFYDAQYLIIDELSYRFTPVKRGDVVVFRYPRDPREFFIKRIIGLPGERVKVNDGKVAIFKNPASNTGLILDDSDYLGNTPTLGQIDVVLSKDQYYLLGDNRGASLDSRIFGAVDKRFIIGRVWIRGWPLANFKIFDNENIPKSLTK